jgi:hypothetical protein
MDEELAFGDFEPEVMATFPKRSFVEPPEAHQKVR